ncbi:unnamed protein product, partial [Rotaria sp. Silwood1]
MVGIDAKNKHILDQRYICPVCSLILRDPVQLTECGHRQCQTCLSTEQETTIKCQQCQSETLRSDMLLDRVFKNDMKSILIECSFCQWTGILSKYQEHFEQLHLKFQCEYCGKQFNSVNKFNEHKVFECQQLIIDCILKDFGCNERITCANMQDHYLTEQHQHTVLKVTRQMLLQLNDRQMDIDIPRTTMTEASDLAVVQLKDLNKMLNIVVGGIKTLNNDAQRLSNESFQMQIRLSTWTEELLKVKLSVEESNVFLEK